MLALAGWVLFTSASQAEPKMAPRAAVQAYLKKVANVAPAERALVAVATERVQASLKKADRAAASDPKAAAAHEQAALEWVLTAEDLWRAVKKEGEAAELEKKLQAARVELSRTRALLEETQARKGRLEAQLKLAEAQGVGGAGETP